jgi:hypothetical protein
VKGEGAAAVVKGIGVMVVVIIVNDIVIIIIIVVVVVIIIIVVIVVVVVIIITGQQITSHQHVQLRNSAEAAVGLIHGMVFISQTGLGFKLEKKQPVMGRVRS